MLYVQVFLGDISKLERRGKMNFEDVTRSMDEWKHEKCRPTSDIIKPVRDAPRTANRAARRGHEGRPGVVRVPKEDHLPPH
jgi:hypothetical protein